MRIRKESVMSVSKEKDNQLPLFSKRRSKETRETGMARAALAHLEDLVIARGIAREIACASPTQTCDADQVQRVLLEKGIKLGNAAGSLFKGTEWEWTGEIRNSIRITNHARMVRVWRLVK